ncbi:hypothetical protein L915_20513 [Phytophthora nicotianae]|uniref:Uncharacterized protein n=3 Tax=Phytophthora nicotianae TaxID=4792 RepID=W2FQQ7_PHYNI|nr:hypothetical protein L915_20513 [Phytophthora nicotianae]ETO66572.1 hypothetical protein F444_16321 [Phytophthora nicotianae P1976]
MVHTLQNPLDRPHGRLDAKLGLDLRGEELACRRGTHKLPLLSFRQCWLLPSPSISTAVFFRSPLRLDCVPDGRTGPTCLPSDLVQRDVSTVETDDKLVLLFGEGLAVAHLKMKGSLPH